MPSRRSLAAIIVFWLATISVAVFRDVWPLLQSGGAPRVAVELIDEARHNQSITWALTHGERRLGRLTTRMQYLELDDSFRQTHDYPEMHFDIRGVKLHVQKLTIATTVARSGELREQSMDAKLRVHIGNDRLDGEASVRGRVKNGTFVGRCSIRSSLGNHDQDLDPIPVPAGHALNPLHVVNRLTAIRGGQQWRVQEVDPLGESLAAWLRAEARKIGFPFPEPKREPIIARVNSSPESLTWQGQEHSCWVIEYRAAEARARTWVRVADGLVLRQEAYGFGERLTIERED